MVLHLNKIESPSPKVALFGCYRILDSYYEKIPVWLKLDQWFWRRTFFKNFVIVFLLFRNYFLWKWAQPFIWINLSPRHLSMLSAKIGWNWPSFKNFVNVFSPFRNFPTWKRTGPFIWTNLNSLHQNMLCAKFGWNWPGSSREKIKFR